MPSWEDLKLLSSSVARNVGDDAGNITSAGTIEDASTVIDPRLSDFILYGVFNGAFARGPQDSTANIDAQNALPDWTGPTQVSGGAITCQWVVDAASPSGQNLRFNIGKGAANDEAYVEQIVPIGGDRFRIIATLIRATYYRVSASGGTPLGTIEGQYLTASGSTTGSAFTATASLGSDATLYWGSATTTTTPAADAFYLRLRFGVRRNTMAATDTATVDLIDVRTDRGGSAVLVPDIATPASYVASQIFQNNGVLQVWPNYGAAATTAHLTINEAGAVTLVSTASTYAYLDVNKLQLIGVPFWAPEIAAPATPSSGYYAIYAKTDGILYGLNDGGTEYQIGHVSGQYVFPATQNASADANTLDDYEEGTWTPVAKWATVGTSTWTPSVQVGRYTKIGRKVWVDCSYVASQTKGTGAGALTMTGLPFTSVTLTNYFPIGPAQIVGWTLAGVGNYSANGGSNSTVVTFQATGTGSLNVALGAAHFAAGPASIEVYFSLAYEV